MAHTIISVVIPYYNTGYSVRRALQSVLRQTYRYFEIIIVNDGSTDDIEKIANEFQKIDERIKYVKHEFNRGLSAARNTGIKNATGQYIAFLDADDEWLPKKLQQQFEIFQNSQIQDEKLGVVLSGTIFIKMNGQKSYAIPPFDGFILRELLKSNFIFAGGSNCLIKKVVFEHCGLFDESDAMRNRQDYEMWIRIAQKFKFFLVRQYHVKCYISKGISYEVTKRTPLKGVKASQYILKKHEKILEKYPKAYSNHFKFIGVQFLWAGITKKAREYLKKSIKIYPLNYPSYIYFFISLLGGTIGRLIMKIILGLQIFNKNYPYI